MRSSFTHFTVTATQTCEEHGKWHDARSVSSITDGDPIEFSIAESSEYLDLGHSYLYVDAKVTAADGTAVTDKKVGSINLFVQSLFS